MAAVAVSFVNVRLGPDDIEPQFRFNYGPDLYSNMEAPYVQAMEVDETAGAEVAESKSAVRSCTTCSKAKAKCVKRPNQQICERYRDRSFCKCRISS